MSDARYGGDDTLYRRTFLAKGIVDLVTVTRYLRGQYTAARKVSFPSCRIVVTVSADHAGETSETR